jgi:hypothetical protein
MPETEETYNPASVDSSPVADSPHKRPRGTDPRVDGPYLDEIRAQQEKGYEHLQELVEGVVDRDKIPESPNTRELTDQEKAQHEAEIEEQEALRERLESQEQEEGSEEGPAETAPGVGEVQSVVTDQQAVDYYEATQPPEEGQEEPTSQNEESVPEEPSTGEETQPKSSWET